MAVLNVNINIPALSIAEYNSKFINATNTNEQANLLSNLLSGIACGQWHGTITATSRDTDAIAATSGSGSVQDTFTK